MSEQLASIDELTHAIAGISHVEKPYLISQLELKKLLLEKAPLDKELQEAEAKVGVWNAEIKNIESWSFQWFLLFITAIATEKRRACNGLKKAEEKVKEARVKVDGMNERIQDITRPNEKNAIDHRTLQKYREELTELLDGVLQSKEMTGTIDALRQEVDDIQYLLEQIEEEDKRITHVREHLDIADIAILEAIVELRHGGEKSVDDGKIYFPQIAYDALKEARMLCPELPSIAPPEKYVDEADDTGAYYSPMQRYLWDVRRRLEELMKWCADKVQANMETNIQKKIELGYKIDEWNVERRRLAKQMLNT
ncbi:hypothetical protein EC973_003743 [Apophysomyces ossiformis]|uniref:Uncharacterized protein n=1 Tax=Apophysomyces ossiformis TaxID=679940 RepID=A0A8H7BFE0_9FUNG|nr:hypothetical protein EC973_003743 [Apophysomyces ossiformis]